MFIIRSARSLSKISKAIIPSTHQPLSLLMTPKQVGFGFATSKWNKQQFLKKLDKEIMDSYAQIVWEDPATENYFAKKHWKIRYIEQKTMFEYSKIDGQHEIRVLAHVMYAPPNDPDHAEYVKAQKDDPDKKLNYSQVGIYIRKKGTQKWLAAEMAVLEGSIELMGAFFTPLDPNFSWKKNTYPGPELETLPQEIVNGINTIFTEFGLTSEVIMNMVIHASIKVDPLDLQWLKNLRQIWG